MSHNTHIFLINNANDINDAMMTIDNTFIDQLPSFCDYFRVLGAINLNTGEYKEWVQLIGSNPNTIRSKNALEEFANELYSEADWKRLQSDLERYTKAELYWNASAACKALDGIKYIKDNGFPKWTADPDKAFAINDGSYDMEGISDWRTIEDKSDVDPEQLEVYAVIVDFHS